MILNERLTTAIDLVFAETGILSGFSKRETQDGISLRRYVMVTSYAERGVTVYRDKWWTKNGGQVFVDLLCFVPEVQRALSGVDERWQESDYNHPVFSFQYRIMEATPRLQWQIDSPESIAAFTQELADFLANTGTEWFGRLDSRDGVLDYFAKKEDAFSLALMCKHLGSAESAREHVCNYLKKLPRHIQHQIDRLSEAGVLSQEDKTYILAASLQRNDEYQRRVENWIGALKR
jgi:hypothetical protein